MEVSVELGGAKSFIEYEQSSLVVNGDLMKLSDKGTWEIVITANDTSFSEETIVHKKSFYLRVVDPIPKATLDLQDEPKDDRVEAVTIKEDLFKGAIREGYEPEPETQA